MTEDDALAMFGMPADIAVLPRIKVLLRALAEKERSAQGAGDTELMKLLCVHLFWHGNVEDSVLVWEAKSSSMDADGSIDIQLICGAGLDVTSGFLRRQGTREALDALQRLEDSVASGDFESFSLDDYRTFWTDYYADEE